MSHHKLLLTTLAIMIAAGALLLISPEHTNIQLTHQKQENLQCLARATITARGQDWVNKHVPYNQGGTHDGYRTDCSGFVSMCWELAKPGLTTFTMHTVAHNITKDQLQPGDALNCDSRHIVLFDGWTDSARTHYVAMEQANSATGTVKRTTPYPYWNADTCFHPIRYNNVC